MEKEKKEVKEFKKIRCPYCNSTFNYFKVKENIWQCRRCGKKFIGEENNG